MRKFHECAKSNQKSCLFEHNLVSNGISSSRFDYATIWTKRNNLVYFIPSEYDHFLEFSFIYLITREDYRRTLGFQEPLEPLNDRYG